MLIHIGNMVEKCGLEMDDDTAPNPLDKSLVNFLRAAFDPAVDGE